MEVSGSVPVKAQMVVRWGILGAVMLSVLALEVGFRRVKLSFSGNLAHVAQVPTIVASAGESPQPAILMIGNSLTRDGVDLALLQPRLADFHIAKVTPDGTAIWDWQCILRHQVFSREVPGIEVVVIGVAWQLLSDQTRVDPSRLGASHCRVSDLMRAGTIGIRSTGDLGEFLLAGGLRLYAQRNALRNRLLSQIVPHYEHFVSGDVAASEGREVGGGRTVAYSYGAFGRMLDELRDQGIKVVVVAMPVQTPYEVAPVLKALADQGALTLLDYRHLEGITPASYRDAIHLAPSGSQLLTARLARDLAEAISAR